jgi:hypothetical protein
MRVQLDERHVRRTESVLSTDAKPDGIQLNVSYELKSQRSASVGSKTVCSKLDGNGKRKFSAINPCTVCTANLALLLCRVLQGPTLLRCTEFPSQFPWLHLRLVRLTCRIKSAKRPWYARIM